MDSGSHEIYPRITTSEKHGLAYHSEINWAEITIIYKEIHYCIYEAKKQFPGEYRKIEFSTSRILLGGKPTTENKRSGNE